MAWLADELHAYVMMPWAHVILALTSVLCGAIVGSEREKHEKPAGLRTLILVCLGSAAFTMASFAFSTTTNDSGRVAAQIVTGIGFLGAGAILHSSGMVRGMTTAATIWATAAIGMVVGVGYPLAGVGLSLLVRLILSAVSRYEDHVFRNVAESQVELVYDADGGKTRIRIEKIMEDFHVSDALKPEEASPTGEVRITLPCRLQRRHRRQFLDEVAGLPQVKSIKERTGTGPRDASG